MKDKSNTIKALSSKKFWVEGIIITLGMLVTAVSVHFFLVPSKLVLGSISGLCIVIYALTDIPVSVVALILNSFLLIIAYLVIGKEFGLKTVYAALIMSPWLYLLETFFPMKESVMGDPWFDLLCFVVLLSAAQAALFRINASTGGLDIVAKIVNMYFHIDLGTAVSIVGAAICCTAFLIHDLRFVIIGLIGTWMNGLVLNHFTAGLNQKKRVCIISKEHKVLQDFIINKINRGVTLYEVTGGYTNEKSVEIEVLLARDEFATLMKFIEKKSINAFITAGNVSEVYGLWNKHRL